MGPRRFSAVARTARVKKFRFRSRAVAGGGERWLCGRVGAWPGLDPAAGALWLGLRSCRVHESSFRSRRADLGKLLRSSTPSGRCMRGFKAHRLLAPHLRQAKFAGGALGTRPSRHDQEALILQFILHDDVLMLEFQRSTACRLPAQAGRIKRQPRITMPPACSVIRLSGPPLRAAARECLQAALGGGSSNAQLT